MGLTFGLSPVVYAELYEMLSARGEDLTPRLELIGRESEWLATMSRWYRLLWQQRLEVSESAEQLHGDLGPEHGYLATWLLSSLRGECDGFSRELRSRSARTLRDAEDQGASAAGAFGRPAVVSWSLGCVPGLYDRELPVLFAEPVADRHVRLAYDGLVEHLVDMGTRPEPWPEVASSAVVWRCAGLAEGVARGGEDLLRSLYACMGMVKGLLPDQAWRRVRASWPDFRDHRNALTHLGEASGAGFADVQQLYSRREDMADFLTAATAFVGSVIRSALQEGGDLGRRAMSLTVEGQLSWLDDYMAS